MEADSGCRLRDEQGQASVEYLLVGVVLISLIVALGALWRLMSDGRMDRLLSVHASHAIDQMGGIVDVLLF